MDRIKEHEEVLELLRHLWAKTPEKQFCEMLFDVTWPPDYIGDIDDEELKEELRQELGW